MRFALEGLPNCDRLGVEHVPREPLEYKAEEAACRPVWDDAFDGDVWPAEPIKWPHLSHLIVKPIVGTVAERQNALATAADIYTINVENLPWLLNDLGERFPFDIVVWKITWGSNRKGFWLWICFS